MYWSDAIHEKAQQWANYCKFQYSTKEFRRQPDFPVGENVYESSATGNFQPMNWAKAVTAWYNEIVGMGGKSIDTLTEEGPETGHFTQVVWANSYLIGCGFAQHQTGGLYQNLYVCQYGPVGNVVGYPIYSASPTKACVCPEGTSCGNPTFENICCPTGVCSWQDQIYYGMLIPGTIPQALSP